MSARILARERASNPQRCKGAPSVLESRPSIADEVITAFGRTGAWTGSRLWNVKPDMVTTAKAITNGFFPFGAVMLGDKVVEAFEADKSGTITKILVENGQAVEFGQPLFVIE